MQLFFLSAAHPFRKTLGPNATIGNYLPKRLTSHETTIPDTLEALCESLNSNRDKGLLKGHLTQPLHNESRAGKTNRSAPSKLVVLDLDGIPYTTPEDFMTAVNLADYQFIWKPSSSNGILDEQGHPIKPRLRGHIYLILSQPVTPETQKTWIRYLNLRYFADHLHLSPTGHSIDWLIDPCMAESSRVLFLSDPVVLEPWRDTLEDRSFQLVHEGRGQALVPSNVLTSSEVVHSAQKRAEKFKQLRSDCGLSTRRRFSPNEVITNPEPNTISFVGEARGFAYYNVGGGNSTSYFHPIDDPDVMYTFKDEPSFKFQKMDPVAYEDALRRIQQTQQASRDYEARFLAFRDYESDVHYTAEWDQTNDRVTAWPTAKTNLEDFMRANATPMPDPIPQIRYVFRPDMDFAVELDQRGRLYRVNAYSHSDLDRIRVCADIPVVGPENVMQVFNRDFASLLALTHHVLGDETESTVWFLNWLAYCVQTRQKPQTALIITGDLGTGKDSLLNLVLEPLFGGPQYSYKTTLQDLSSNFNRWASYARLVSISEARQGDIASDKHNMLINNLKEWVTNHRIAMRAMYRDTIAVTNYSAFVLLSNFYDVLKLSENDRRFTVTNRQTVSLTSREFPLAGEFNFRENRDLAYNQMRTAINAALPRFTEYLKAFAVDRHMVMTPLDNEAKRQMTIASMNSFESFVDRLINGDLDYFVEYLDRDPIIEGGTNANRVSLLSARNGLRIIFSQILRRLNEPVTMTRDQLIILWAAMSNEDLDKIAPNTFSKRLIRNGVVLQIGGNVLGAADNRTTRGVRVIWRCETYAPDVLHQLLQEHAPSQISSNEANIQH